MVRIRASRDGVETWASNNERTTVDSEEHVGAISFQLRLSSRMVAFLFAPPTLYGVAEPRRHRSQEIHRSSPVSLLREWTDEISLKLALFARLAALRPRKAVALKRASSA